MEPKVRRAGLEPIHNPAVGRYLSEVVGASKMSSSREHLASIASHGPAVISCTGTTSMTRCSNFAKQSPPNGRLKSTARVASNLFMLASLGVARQRHPTRGHRGGLQVTTTNIVDYN